MKNNCFVHFTIDAEGGSQYGIYNSEANLIMCACCGSIYFLDEGITILDTVEIGMEVYDTLVEVFEEEAIRRKNESEI